jgi:hypothetical protein
MVVSKCSRDVTPDVASCVIEVLDI